MPELPKVGDRIPIEQFHVSETNVRFGKVFGESEEDQHLIGQLRRGKIVQPFKARPEGEGFGVYMGRRRFLAKKELGTTAFVVGTDVIIREVDDDDARESSFIENLPLLKDDVDPITLAEGLAEILSNSTLGVRAFARRWGISPAYLSEHMTVLALAPSLQETLRNGLLSFTDGLRVARMKLGDELQDSLAETLATQGVAAFKRDLERIPTGKRKRGIPRGIYEIDRIVWDTRNRREMAQYEMVKRASERRGFEKVPDYIKDYLLRHIDDIEHEAVA